MSIYSTPNRRRSIVIRTIFAIVALGLAGCPSPNASGTAITSVDIEGSVRGTEFVLVLNGRGFGLTEVTYDISKSEGAATALRYNVLVLDRFGNPHKTIEEGDVEIVSPVMVRATFRRRTPLEPGVYMVNIGKAGANGVALASLENAFEVRGDEPIPDGGPPDQGVAPVDTGRPGPDAGIVDGGFKDADIPEVGVPDTGPADSGLGPWIGNFAHRRPVQVTNMTVQASPTGVTVRVPLPHASFVAANTAQADGDDLALYRDGVELEYQFEDVGALDTNDLVLVARLADPFAVGTETLALYYGDPNRTAVANDGVFVMSQRFDQNLPNGWFANSWGRTCTQRVDDSANRSYCVGDSNANPTRRTIASPPMPTILADPGDNTTYEVVGWLAGFMAQDGDLLYFTYSDTNNNFAGSTTLDDADYDPAYPPNDNTTFEETNGNQRAVRGWRFPANPGIDWTAFRARFRPSFDGPSLQLRFISLGPDAGNATIVALDDLTLRLALEPDFAVQLGAAETR